MREGMGRFKVHFKVVMDCTEYVEGDNLYEVYSRVTNGELEQIPLDQITKIEYLEYQVHSVGMLDNNGVQIPYAYLGLDKEK